ncbi:MAG: hypothetical protein HY815_26200 [Candidatus Riflebacteria bacterium]|nr:hypothetical protein [Candidatus Riflebacteria bacterium]
MGIVEDPARVRPICPACHLPIDRDPQVACPWCKTAYHSACQPAGGCVVAGCAPPPPAPSPAAPTPRIWWMAHRAWLVFIAVGIGLSLRNSGAHLVPDGYTGVVAVLSFYVAMGLTGLGCIADLRCPGPRKDSYGTHALLVTGVVAFGAPVLFGVMTMINRSASSVGVTVIFPAILILSYLPPVLALVGLVRDRKRFRALGCLALYCLPILSAIMTPGYKPARARANTRACYANQKTIAGAIEMYNLDRNTRRTVIDQALFRMLKSGGYLQSIPDDPGNGTGSWTSYQYTPGGNGITCLTHGPIRLRSRSGGWKRRGSGLRSRSGGGKRRGSGLRSRSGARLGPGEAPGLAGWNGGGSLEVAVGGREEEGIRIEVALGGATRTRRGAGSSRPAAVDPDAAIS